MKKVRIAVRSLVEFILQSGDIVSGFSGSSRTADAIKAHQKIQKSGGENYLPEVSISKEVNFEDICLEISGRIDGVITAGETIIIDEIKTTTRPIHEIEEDYNYLHWAQAKCYAYIYGTQNNIETIDVQLTYYNLDSKETKCFKKSFTVKRQLEEFFYDLVNRYVDWARVVLRWQEERDSSIIKSAFPHSEFRKGQRDMAVRVFRTVKDGGKLFAQAPTGTGKTIASLFPVVKGLGEGHVSKIFYLTAKTVTGTLAESAVQSMRKQGVKLKTVSLCAKEKICFKEETNCNPEYCEFAKGHFDRERAAVEDIFNESSFRREVIEEYARKHRVCPFEFSLDLSLWADCIICDYNYVFDPRVYLKRFFLEGSGDFVFLVDEAHNLVDRSREMFSAELYKHTFLELKKQSKGKAPEVHRELDKVNKYFIEERKNCLDQENLIVEDAPKELYTLLRKFTTVSEKWLLQNGDSPFKKSLLEQYFEVLSFIRTFEMYDDKYVTYVEKSNNDVKIKLFCLDPSFLLSECMKRGKASILFSATLSPMDYFIKILGGEEKDLRVKLKSPFPKENLCVVVDDSISTRFSQRESTYSKVAEAIYHTTAQKKGNYLVFFPSYKYLNQVYEIFSNLSPKTKTIIQNSGMKDEEREAFLERFSEEIEETLVGFAVMGGIFGEGIDLTGDRLSGAIIVGVGLPQISFERNIIKDYFQEHISKGFEYAYIYPGMNKVMQAVGRVIRTEHDRGIVVLIDDRFSHNQYKSLFPEEWEPVKKARSKEGYEKVFENFWKDTNND